MEQIIFSLICGTSDVKLLHFFLRRMVVIIERSATACNAGVRTALLAEG
jgi:hypothetical protein